MSTPSSPNILVLQETTGAAQQYGRAYIFQFYPESPNQLFIIATSHRDSLTCANGPTTPKVQAEVYKIGEWLIRNRGLRLLLPEGFFREGPQRTVRETNRQDPWVTGKKSPELLDMKALERRLSDNKIYVNAEMLLKDNYPLYLAQIEDRNLYFAVSEGIRKLVNGNNPPREYLPLKSELDYLQDRRTAAILQKVPEIVQNEFDRGVIHEKKAFLTIGMNHIPSIVKYLEEKKIKIYCPSSVPVRGEDFISDLNLIKEDFGVSILLPRTLVKDREILRISGLDKVMMESRYSLVPSLAPLP